jgi:Mn2+/Fe2+ NRAMP family transporter
MAGRKNLPQLFNGSNRDYLIIGILIAILFVYVFFFYEKRLDQIEDRMFNPGTPMEASQFPRGP